eukprot:CAMPEP_0181056734 /NCGR_PEP_ID=MMETSP1070-20121207/19875_1 /TAXON_ID=265543 /ORGANISM="Minutocellus polymorphus, Strain NH13" /LENGTH=550 /DNA_ID=CAMNT_0023136101 /DNA_START=227 /DNA_END=1879 /DNA_ORIENTATION=+
MVSTSKSTQRRRVQVQVLLLAATAASSIAFVPNSNNVKGDSPLARVDIIQRAGQTLPSSTALPMVLDFFRQRAEEGVDQAKKLADAAAKGKLGEGLVDAAFYTKQTNEAFATGLAKSRNKLLYGLESAFSGGGDILEELEDVLLQADLGLSTAEDVMSEVKSLREDSTQIFSRDDIRSILRGKLIEALEVEGDRRIQFEGMSMYQDEQAKEIKGEDGDTDIPHGGKDSSGIPTVLFVMGANGMGKTTTIGKLAARLRIEGGQKVLVAACDTFRAGAVEQLEMWATRAEVDCYSPNEQQKTPAAVLYGSLDKALEGNYDTLVVDTSGRLSNNDALTAELAKMKRVIQKRLSVKNDEDNKPVPNMDVPHETLLVIDAAQGRMALDSAKQWEKEIGLSGLVLTKLDGSARGGSVVAVSRELGLPVKLIGVGEGIDDLRDFDPESFVDGLLGIGAAGGTGKSGEGKALAGRLQELRKARDERAKARKSEKSQVPAVATVGAGSGGPAGEMTLQEMDAPGQQTVTDAGNDGLPKTPRSGKKNNSKKKRKKRKAKK